MTVTNTYTTSTLYTGNGATTDFSTRFLFSANAEVLVYKVLISTGVETLQTITTHYTLTGAGTGSAGTVTFLSAPSSSYYVKIARATPLTQATDYVEGTKFPATTHESALDKLTRIAQELSTNIDRAPKLPVSSVNYPAVFPDFSATTGGYIVRINTGGTALELASPLDASLSASLTPTSNYLIVGNGTSWVSTSPSDTRTALGLVIGTDVQAYNSQLTTLAAYNTNGIFTQTASGTYTGRTLTGTAAEITVTNGSGVSGNPTLSLPSALTFTGKTITGGTFASVTMTAPTLGAATATSINKMAITAPATSSTLAVADGKTLTASNTLTLTGTDSSSVAFGTGGTVAYVANDLSVFAATTSLQLKGVISDETGSGALVFANTPTLVTPVLGVATATSINKLTLTAPATSATLTIADGASLITSGAFSITLTATAGTSVTLPTSGTLVNTAVTSLSSLATVGTISSGTWNGTAIIGTYGGTGVNNGSKTITLGGNLTTSGAFNTTLTVTADTNVTLPTSGTLLTSAGAVTALAGTSNQLTASASTGSVTMSLPSDIILPGRMRWVKGADIASTGSMTWGADGNFFHITGTTTITSFNSLAAGAVMMAEFTGALTLTHNATSLIIPNGGSNITTAAGDCAIFMSEGSGNWRCTHYQLASGGSLNTAGVTSITGTVNQITASASTGAVTLSIPATAYIATSLDLGHASDTTITRSGAGDIAVEGNGIYRAGGTDVAVVDGGTGVSTLTTAYGVLCAGTTATGAVQTLGALGASGTVLTSNGASALPSFQAATGTWVKITSTTASSSASVAFTGLSSTYRVYRVVLEKVLPATDAVDLWIRTSSDNGSTYDASASDYYYGVTGGNGGAAMNFQVQGAAQILPACNGSFQRLSFTTGEALDGYYDIFDHASTYCTVQGVASFQGASTNYMGVSIGTGRRVAASAVNGIKFLMSSGNIASGVFTLYGLTA